MLEDSNGIPVGRTAEIKRFMKGVFRVRPSLPRYNYTWDVNMVLDYLKLYYPDEVLPLSRLTLNLTRLLALFTVQRAQTLHVLEYTAFSIYVDMVIIPNKDF